MAPALSIVFPAYNEARRLPPTLRKVIAFLDARKLDAELLVVDDGSRDGMGDAVAKEFGARVRVLSYGGNRGKGYAVRHGYLEARGDRVLMSDADLSTPIDELDGLSAAMDRDHLDVAMGSRAFGNVMVAQRGIRSFAGKIYNKIVRVILPLPFRDTQCGFKLFRRERCRPVFEAMRIDRFSFDVEMVFLAQRVGLKLAEVPVHWYNDAESKVSFLRDASRMFLDVLRIRKWSMTGGYPVLARATVEVTRG